MFFDLLDKLNLPLKLLVLAGLTIGTHLLVIGVRRTSMQLTSLAARPSMQMLKLKSVASLLTSALVFSLYFLALGLVLREFNVSLTAYLASASIVGLAVGFGSQGIVQDVVTGLTLIFSDLFDVDEMVEISGQSGIVKSIGMRFVELENSYGARIFIPNRTITNVINYPRGYVRCIADIALSDDPPVAAQMVSLIERLVAGTSEQFPGILRTPPTIEGRMRRNNDQEFLRVKFRIWPGRGDPIEKTFKPEVLAGLKSIEPGYMDWQIAVYYEVEKQTRVRR